MRRCKRLAIFLVAVLMLSMVYSQPGVIEAQAATKNNITAVGIKALPKNNTIELGEYFNFNPVILNTEQGKGKETTGVVYFEVNGKTNTAGVQSARWGNIYPVFAGQFDVRAVAFANSSDMRAWLAARKANGYVEDAKAGARYVTAYSDWQTIKVTSSEEGLAVARWQKQLDLALKNKNVSNVLFTTDAEKEFTLKKGNYRYKAITIDAPNADIVNEGRFKEITVEQIKSSTFYEKAIGNRFIVTAPNASFHVEKDATVNEFVYRPATSNTTTVAPKLNIFGNGGSIDKVSIESKGEVNIDGNTENTVPVVVEETAAGTVLNTNIQLDLNVNASITLDVGAAATNTVVNLLKAVEAIFSGAAETLNVNVGKDAGGAVVKSETSVTIKAEADFKAELGEGAEGSEITTGENVNAEVKNDTKEDVTIKDNDGNSTTVEKGEEVAPTVTPTPVPTNTPNPPVTSTPVPTATSTPIPTVTPIPTTTPSDKVEVTKITVTSKEGVNVIVEGETLQLIATVEPDNATDKEVTWTSSDENIATVDENGIVTGVKDGTVTIKATAKDGSNIVGEFDLTVNAKDKPVVNVSEITITSEGNATEIVEGGTLKLTATVKPDNATNKKVTWTSSDENIATVDENGIVTGVKDGTVTIKAIANDGSTIEGKFDLTVTAKSEGSLSNVATLESISYTIDGVAHIINGSDFTEAKNIIVKVDSVPTTNTVEITTKTTDSKATVKVEPTTIQLTDTVTQVKIIVTAEDNVTTETYTIYFFSNPFKDAKIVAEIKVASGAPVVTNGVVKVTTGTSIVKVDGVSVAGNDANLNVAYEWYESEDQTKWTTIANNSASFEKKYEKDMYIYVKVVVTFTKDNKEEKFEFISKTQ